MFEIHEFSRTQSPPGSDHQEIAWKKENTVRICGVAFAGENAALVVLDALDNAWDLVPSEPGKLTLSDPFDTGTVRHFQTAARAFLQEMGVEQVAIKKKPFRGKMAAGPAAFAMGTVFQVTTEVPLTFVTAQAVKAAMEGDGNQIPDGIKKYQEDAFGAALALVATL